MRAQAMRHPLSTSPVREQHAGARPLQVSSPSQLLLQAGCDRLPQGVLLFDGAGDVAFANRAARGMLDVGNGLVGLVPQDLAGRARLVATVPSAGLPALS
jgi:PAS domain-containing protein